MDVPSPKGPAVPRVQKGKLLLRFRDRDEVIEEGEFIVVPRGVEHSPAALGSACEVILFEPVFGADKPKRVHAFAPL